VLVHRPVMFSFLRGVAMCSSLLSAAMLPELEAAKRNPFTSSTDLCCALLCHTCSAGYFWTLSLK